MKIDPDHFDIIIDPSAHHGQATDSIKTIIKKCTGNNCCNKSYYRIAGETAAANTNGGKYSRKKK
jgi:hypothetical protein